jgi:hypothetical protein
MTVQVVPLSSGRSIRGRIASGRIPVTLLTVINARTRARQSSTPPSTTGTSLLRARPTPAT